MTHYYENDIAELMRGVPYIALSNDGLLDLLKKTAATGKAYAEYLPQYPAVRVEPLDFLYQCRHNVDALDEHLLNDLLQATWREANWGAWLALLSPRPEYAALLLKVRGRHPHGTDILALAIAAHGWSVPPALTGYWGWALRIRNMVDALQPQTRTLRTNPTPEQLVAYRAEVESVWAAYKTGGASLALPLTQKGLLGHYREDYWSWSARNATGS